MTHILPCCSNNRKTKVEPVTAAASIFHLLLPQYKVNSLLPVILGSAGALSGLYYYFYGFSSPQPIFGKPLEEVRKGETGMPLLLEQCIERLSDEGVLFLLCCSFTCLFNSSV